LLELTGDLAADEDGEPVSSPAPLGETPERGKLEAGWSLR